MAESPPKKLNEEGFWLAAGRVTKDHAQKVVDTAQKIIDRVLKSEVLRKLVDDVKTLVGMVRDYVRGDYREVSWKSIAAAVVALLYVADPIDLVPDVIPVVGQLDDEATLLLAIYLIGDDLRRYRAWRDAKEEITDDPVQRLNS
jgi:uncharacterized membrane protein YkvA (DUF1232 family)